MKTIFPPFPYHTNSISDFIIYNSNQIITSSWDHSIRIWSLKSSQPISTTVQHKHPVIDLCKSSQSTVFYSLSRFGEIIKWNRCKDRLIRQKKVYLDTYAYKLFYDNKQDILLVFLKDNVLLFFDSALNQIFSKNLELPSKIQHILLHVTSNNIYLVTLNRIYEFNLSNYKVKDIIHSSMITCACITTKDELIFSSEGKSLFKYSLIKKDIELLLTTKNKINMVYCQNNNIIAVSKGDKIYRVSEQNGIVTKTSIFQNTNKILCKTRYLLLNYFDNSFRVYKQENASLKGKTFPGSTKAWTFHELSSKGYIFGLNDGSIHIPHLNCFQKISDKYISTVHAIKLYNNTKQLIASTGSGELVILNVNNFFRIIKRIKIHDGKIWNFKVYKSGTLSAGYDKKVIWIPDLTNITQKLVLNHPTYVNDCIKTNTQIISVADDGVLRTWDLSGHLLKKQQISSNILRCLTYSKRLNVLWIGGYDTKLNLYDMKTQATRELSIFNSFILKLAMNPKNTFLAVGCENGSIYIFVIQDKIQPLTIKEIYHHNLFSPIYDIKWSSNTKFTCLCANGQLSSLDLGLC